MPGIIFNSVTKAHLLQHFQIVISAQTNPLGFEVLLIFLKKGHAFCELGLNPRNGCLEAALARYVLVGGVKLKLLRTANDRPADGLELS